MSYKAQVGFAFQRVFRTEAEAKRAVTEMRAKLAEANKLADGEIWSSIDIIYLTRWDCPTARLAAAMGNMLNRGAG